MGGRTGAHGKIKSDATVSIERPVWAATRQSIFPQPCEMALTLFRAVPRVNGTLKGLCYNCKNGPAAEIP